MARLPPESNGINWPQNRLSAIRRRAIVLAGFCLLAFSAILFARFVTIETAKPEQQAFVKRQFQLGGFLGGMFREAMRTSALETLSVAESVTRDATVTSFTSSHTVEMSPVTSHIPEPPKTSMGMSSSNSFHGDPDKLLEALAAAMRQAMRDSEQLPSTSPKRVQKSFLSDLIAKQSITASISAGSSISPSFQTSGSNSMRNLPAPSVRILGGLSGDSLTLRIHNARTIPEDPPSGSSTSNSFLSEVSKIVAEISGIDPIAAAKLTDTVLDALHVNPSAVASAIPKVASQASLSAADLLPLVIPAVAQAMNQPLPPVPSVSTLDMVETLNKVLQQGTTVINDLSRALEDITDPSLLAVLNQLAMIVSAVASYLDKPLCAVDQVVDGTSFEAVIPCDSAEAESLTSAGQLTTLAAPVLPGLTTPSAVLGASTTLAPPSPYSSSNPAPPSKSVAENPAETNSPPPTNGETGGGPASNHGSPAETTSAQLSCPTCPSCDQCGPKICSAQGPEGPSAHQPPDPSTGPCPGNGFKCNECLDGWFCPPQETPAQVVPCGVGWPCYHCSEGYFCAPTETPAPTPPPSSTPEPPSKDTGNPSTSSVATPTVAPNTSDLPADWSHLGCFQDAISRILIGAKPVDYLQGDMSTKECVSHCISGGYTFAGTENGRECWCGTSIRDDALRLPESQCGKPCQGQPTEACGGSWTMDVFLCSNKVESDQEPPAKFTGGFMFRLLSSFGGHNGGSHRQPS
ncbi:WSC domain-containing protein [Trichoderma chlorosporum]